MKKITLLILTTALGAMASDIRLARMFDADLTVAERNDACFALRGDRSQDVMVAMRRALDNEVLRACAATNLRVGEATDLLRQALAGDNPSARAAAVRQLGLMQKPEFVDDFAKAAKDPNMIVAMNAVHALSAYPDRTAIPALVEIAQRGGMLGVLAIGRLADLGDPQAVVVARKLLAGGEVTDRVAALRVIGEMGDETDLPALRELALKKEVFSTSQRGFGLMPAIDLGRAATATIAQITNRSQPARSRE